MTSVRPFFSIVLPVYNAIEYIEDTLNSLLKQNFCDFELIIVNDGATDGSEKICQKYLKDYNHIKYFNKKNGGICAARNFALKQACGEYVIFCDHDDIFTPDALSVLYKKISTQNCDVLKFSYENQVIKNNKIKKKYIISCFDEVGDSDILLKKNYQQFNAFIYTVWNGVYRLESLRQTKSYFDESIKYGMEDVVFNLNFIKNNKKIIMDSEIFYIHYIRYGQSTSRYFDMNKLNAISFSLNMENEYLKKEISPTLKLLQMSKYIRSYFVTLGLKKNALNIDSIKENLSVFSEQLNYTFSFEEYIFFIRDYKKDVLKIILFKKKMYRTLIFLLKGQ